MERSMTDLHQRSPERDRLILKLKSIAEITGRMRERLVHCRCG